MLRPCSRSADGSLYLVCIFCTNNFFNLSHWVHVLSEEQYRHSRGDVEVQKITPDTKQGSDWVEWCFGIFSIDVPGEKQSRIQAERERDRQEEEPSFPLNRLSFFMLIELKEQPCVQHSVCAQSSNNHLKCAHPGSVFYLQSLHTDNHAHTARDALLWAHSNFSAR